MSYTVTQRLLILILIILYPLRAEGVLDDTELKLKRQFEIPLRWDNIEDEEPWLDGRKPVYNGDYGFHTVRLGCEDYLLVKLYKGRLLRIYNPVEAFREDELSIYLSNGSGLYITYPYSIDHERRSILLTPPERLPYIVRIESTCKKEKVEIGLFHSRYEYIDKVAPYRNLIKLPLERAWISRTNKLSSEAFYLLMPYRPVTVRIKGNATFSIESRFVYNPYDPVRLQPYHIQVRLDGKVFKNLDHETLPHTTTPVYVDGREKIIGRTQRDFMNIPEGEHEMVIESDAILYIRLLRRDEPDYLFTINEPRLTPEDIRKMGSPPLLRKSPWEINKDDLIALTKYNPSPALSEFLTYNLIKDNTLHEGDIIGTMLLKDITKDLHRASDVARFYYLSHTFYRDIIPDNQDTKARNRFYYFITPSLRDITQPSDGILHPEHLEDAIRLLPSSIFTELLNDIDNPLIYYLPDRPSPSFLRIMISKKEMDGDTRLAIQMDDRPPLELRLYRNEKLKKEDFMSSQGEELIKFLSSLPYSIEPQTLSGRFSSLRPPSTIIDTAYLEMPLPQDVKVIRLWKEGRGKPVVSLQYRASRHYSLPQNAYMRYIKSIPSPSRLLIELLRDGEGTIKQLKHKQEWGFPYIYTIMPGDTLEGIFSRAMGLRMNEIYNEYIKRFRTLNPHIKNINRLHAGERIYLPMKFLKMEDIIRIEILNDLIPLYRLIDTRARGFMADINRQESPLRYREEKDVNKELLLVNDLYTGGKYLNAMERLQPLLYQTKGVDREALELLQANILKALGEHFLMENILKGLFVYSGHEETRKEAFHRLSSYYRKTRDTDGLLGLYSTYLLKTHDITIIPEFLDLLIEEGAYEMALKAGLLLPKNYQPVDLLLRACLVESWWQAFDLLIERIQSPEERDLWMAKRRLKEGNYEEALRLFRNSGEIGKKWYESMVEADSIYRGLRDADDKDVHGLIKRWQRWQEKHPGPFRWRVADELLIDSSGALILYNRARDMYHRMFVSKKGKTVKLRVYGPARLRIEARPLFETGSSEAYNGWIDVRDNGKVSHYPVIDSFPSSTFLVKGEKELKAGQKVTLLYDIKEGIHHIEIYSEDIPLLISLYESVPEVKISILPPLNADTIPALVEGGTRGLIQSIISELSASSFMEGKGPALFSTKDIMGPDVIGEMIKLLWEAEHDVRMFKNNLETAERIFINNRHIPRLKSLIYRFYRKTKFTPIEDVLSSGGIRIVKITGESASIPDMRIRASMIPPLMPGEQLLYGYERIILDMKNLREKKIEVEIRSESIAYLPPEPMEIFFEIDGERVRAVRIGEKDKKDIRLHLRVREGEHYLRIGISRPVVNQFLRVRLWERIERNEMPLIKTIERRYYLATPDEPVVLAAEGPLMLYVEKRVNNESMMNYIEVEKGIHNLEFYPEPTEKEALFRFYKRVPFPEKPTTPRRRFVVEYKEADTPPVRVNEPLILKQMEFDDRISLGSQEDGTWSITGAFMQKRQMEAEEKMEEFIESRLTHRFFNAFSRNLQRYEALGRIRKHGGPTFGALGHITHRPLKTPYGYNLNASFYAQRPSVDGGYEYSLNLDASIIDKRELGIKTYHTPSLAAFLRLMSMDDYDGYHPGNVDQDIFTTYKAGHRYGLRIADTLFYRPWLDTILSLYGKVVLNEDLNPFEPDNYGFEIRWRQLVGGLKTDLSYQENHYLSDRDRNEHTTTRRIKLGASLEKWLNLHKRLEAGFGLIWHLSINQFSGRLYLSIHFGKARGYRDFHYGEIDFKDLRQMHISYEEENNRIIKDKNP
jgi:hypothetical protein